MNTYTEQELREALTSLAESDQVPVDVWAALRSRVTRRRYARASAVASLAAAVAVAAVAWPNGKSPDTVRIAGHGTATVRLTPDRALSKSELNTTVDILRHRLDALGVTGEIGTDGDVVTVSVASAAAELVSRLGARGEVQWRQVLAVKPANGSGAVRGPVATAGDLAGAQRQFQQQGCAHSQGSSNTADGTIVPAASFLVACTAAGDVQYLLAPSAASNADIASAHAELDSQAGNWLVTVTFTHRGSQAWRQLTARAAQQPQPQQCQPPAGCNSIGIVIDGQIIATPIVESGPGGLVGGMTQITGQESQNAARLLAAEVAAPPLGAPMTATTTAASAQPSP